jgi:hypothetical protein
VRADRRKSANAIASAENGSRSTALVNGMTVVVEVAQ